MEFYKLILERRNQLILLILCSAGIMVLAWRTLVQPQQDRLHVLTVELAKTQESVQATRLLVGSSDEYKASLQAAAQKLQAVEQRMAQGDVYRWTINTMLGFQEPFGVDFAEFPQPQIAELNIPPKVPYKAATTSVAGTATYHDFGRFLATFENEYPHFRLQRLELEPATQIQTDPNEPGKLSFRMEFLALVKSSVPAR